MKQSIEHTFEFQLMVADQLLSVLLKVLTAFCIIAAVNAYVAWSYWPLIQQLIAWLTR